MATSSPPAPPRRLPTLIPPSPAVLMSRALKPPDSNTQFGSEYAAEMRRIAREVAAHSPRTLQKELGPSEIGTPCLSGDTEVVTRNGLRKIADIASDGEAELLVPLLYSGSDIRKRWGRFQRAPVSNFGIRELLKVTLRRAQETKIIHATADHHWYRSYWSGKIKKQERLTTTELKKGHRLTQLRRARPLTTTMMPFAVAQGFVFGDGTKGTDDDRHQPATLNLYHNGKDEALLPFFPGEHSEYQASDKAYPYTIIRGLPRFWKKLPPIDESTSFLMSWLAGYFAADGTVTEEGHCSISSANPAYLDFVRNIAAICGIGYGQIQCEMRRGISGNQVQKEKTALYRLSLRRWDLPTWFFLTERHLERVKSTSSNVERDPHWIVESVESTGRMEPVYCATVDGVGAFGLADDLMTGNCDRQVVGKLAGIPATNHVVDPWASIVGIAIHAWLAEAFRSDNERYSYVRWLAEFRVHPHPDHPGTGDLYDFYKKACVDHKGLGDTTAAALRKHGPPQRYFVQLLAYRRGFQLMGLPVEHILIVVWPRTKSTLDPLYVWHHIPTPDDDIFLDQIFELMSVRKAMAEGVRAGQLTLNDITPTPDDEECYFCPFYRPDVLHDRNATGCAGHHLLPGRTK